MPENCLQPHVKGSQHKSTLATSGLVMLGNPPLAAAQGFIPGADGRCRCDPALSAGCLQCIVPGTCGPTPTQPLTGPVCKPGYGLVTDPAAPERPGQCVCLPSTAGPNCEACVVPGKCAACAGVFTLSNGICSAIPCPLPPPFSLEFSASCPAIHHFNASCNAYITQFVICQVDLHSV